jgi:DNA-directed RNA polymerase subunit RPC12/RpoP
MYPYFAIIIGVVVIAIVVGIRLYLMRRPGTMRAKCSKCGVVFDASRSFELVHIGTLKQIKCPSCGKISFMKTYVKDPITWPPKEETQPQAPKTSPEELEKQRIEDSKYEKT